MIGQSIHELAQRNRRLGRRLSTYRGGRAHDVLALLRQECVRAGYVGVEDPDGVLSPVEAAAWEHFGFRMQGDSRWTPEPWRPTWLELQAHSPGEAAAQLAPRRPNTRVRSDLFYQVTTGFAESLSMGQRECVRAVAIAAPSSTVLCVLPTGSGKTEVVLTRAITARPRQTLLITPTVALALDLERRVQEMVSSGERFAYFGDLSPDDKADFRSAIAEGRQWLTITSPEAACTALVHALEVCAREGRLDQIAVDEAHIVAEWGDDFRPAFQAMAGLRRRLLALSPKNSAPATILLTGTLDDYGLTSLLRLFPGEEELVISAQVTRPEPSWWSAHCESESQKHTRFLEAVRRLPRPLIVYTTLHASERSTNTATARGWLENAGFKSVAVVDGGTPSRGRSQAVVGLRASGRPEDDIDIVVATSAFGLGVDISDVRSVIHLCVPESVDRLYQEVGRTGRDGKASVSLTLWTDEDREVAAGMAEARLLGADTAWDRWDRLRLGRSTPGAFEVDLTAAHERIKYPWSDANKYWNRQTLGAMDRAGMIRLHWPEAPEVPSDADDDAMQDYFQGRNDVAAVELLQGDIGNSTVFLPRFAAAQTTARNASSASLSSAMEMLEGLQECTNRYLSRHYALDRNGDVFPVVRQCGGCPDCRRLGRPVHVDHVAVTPVMAGKLTTMGDAILKELAPDGRLCAWTEGTQTEADDALVERLISHGVRRLVSHGLWQPTLRNNRGTWWVERVGEWLAPPEPHLKTPTLLRFDASLVSSGLGPLALSRLAKMPVGIVLVSGDQRDPADERKLLRQTWLPSYRIEDVLERI